MIRPFALLIFCPICLCVSLAAWAAPITVPTDLNLGDKYRLAFVTSTGRDGSSNDIADYNSFVAAVAAGVPELAALGATWTAIASTATVAARDNTGTNPSSPGVPIYLLNDTRIAENNADLWDGTLLAAININQGNLPQIDPVQVWTGTDSDGTAFQENYLGSPAEPAIFGFSSHIGFAWIIVHTADHDIRYPFYGLSDELTVVPEPGTMTLVCIGATAVVAWRLRRRQPRKRQ